jgi:AhpD family alkylhydroperoxidase
VRVSQLNHCRFCVDLNAATLLRREVSEAKLWTLEDWHRSDLFSERERVALAYLEAITRSEEVSGELMARVRQQFDGDAIIELTALIAFQNMSSKFNAALGVPPQGFCRLPPPAGRTPW